jgi:hypothetical protein
MMTLPKSTITTVGDNRVLQSSLRQRSGFSSVSNEFTHSWLFYSVKTVNDMLYRPSKVGKRLWGRMTRKDMSGASGIVAWGSSIWRWHHGSRFGTEDEYFYE